MAERNSRIIIAAGPGRGTSTLGKKLSEEHKLTHLCTDPQRLLSADMNGTPDDLDYGGENGVGQWVSRNWLGRDRALIEGVHAIDGLKHTLRSFPDAKSSDYCDRLIILTERVRDEPEKPGERRQCDHILRVLEELESQLDNLELWYPVDGSFQRASF
jgi:hypothetical protein